LLRFELLLGAEFVCHCGMIVVGGKGVGRCGGWRARWWR
jgi:hypothetical protein